MPSVFAIKGNQKNTDEFLKLDYTPDMDTILPFVVQGYYKYGRRRERWCLVWFRLVFYGR